MTAWLALDPNTRAELMAHEMFKAKSDRYYSERIREHAKREKKGFSPFHDPLTAIKARWGLKY